VRRYGRDEETWDRLVEAGLAFLVERARLQMPTSYTELNAVLMRRTGLSGFDFERADERAAMGYLLGLIVDRNYPSTHLLISALVHYLNANEPGPGFYNLAADRGDLPRNTSSNSRDEFWISQLNALYEHYAL
jgi:hypothetical protein